MSVNLYKSDSMNTLKSNIDHTGVAVNQKIHVSS